MRKPCIVGNWKMNLTLKEGTDLIEEVVKGYDADKCDVGFSPSYCYLQAAVSAAGSAKVYAQNINENDSGAYTGEVSPAMLKDLSVDGVIIGHSERRTIYNEGDELINQKVLKALSEGFEVILCVGEKLGEREAGAEYHTVLYQTAMALSNVTASQMEKVIIAYEPVWAIGTGKTATPEDAQNMHAKIRELLGSLYNNTVAQNTRILYGGSVKPANAKELLGMSDIDGALVGGASLKAGDFLGIINS